jgi:uncharacterized protein YutE (UPF0331/DUF86 family)
MIDKEIIENKIKNIKKYFKEIEPLLKLEVRFLIDEKNYQYLRTLERDFQLIVDGMVDINSHLMARLDLPVSDDYQSTFITLGENGILPIEFALKIAPAVGMRNKVVHKYDIIDNKKFIEDLKSGAKDFMEYVKLINEFLKIQD